MSGTPNTTLPKAELAIVCSPGHHCPACGGAVFSPVDRPALRIMSIERKGDKVASAGSIPMSRCAVCGAAVHEINRVVPIELDGLTCKCGGKEFRFEIRSLKPNRKQNPTEWDFDLDITCVSCSKRRLVE